MAQISFELHEILGIPYLISEYFTCIYCNTYNIVDFSGPILELSGGASLTPSLD